MKKEFYNKTKDLIPSEILKRFFNTNETKTIKTAMDLGCGAGKDTKYLLEKGLNVIAVDAAEVSNYIDIENSNLKFIKSKFENLKFNNVDLINAQNSLSFLSPENFNDVIIKIKNAINKYGYFIGNFFGKNDEWSKEKEKTFLSKEEILEIFKDFKLKYIAEVEEEGKTTSGKEKHWHIIYVIAQKI